MSVEQGAVTEPEINQRVNPQELAPKKPERVNLESFYQTVLALYRERQKLSGRNAWETIEGNFAAKNDKFLDYSLPSEKPTEEQKPKSLRDNIRKATLGIRARSLGVRDMQQFLKVVDYVEHASYEYDRHGKKVPLRLGIKDVESIKNLMSSQNEPVEILKGLRKIGFTVNKDLLSSKENMGKLSLLFNAQNVQDALNIAQDISALRNTEWFSRNNGGSIDFLIHLAQNPDPKSSLSSESIHKIDILSKSLLSTMDVRMGVNELETIATNPDYLEFFSYLIDQNHFLSYERSLRIQENSFFALHLDGPVFDNITALDKAGVLKPLLTLFGSGISAGYSAEQPLTALFFSLAGHTNSAETQKETIDYFQNLFSKEEIKSFLQDKEKQEFSSLIAELTNLIPIDDLNALNTLYTKKEEALYLAKLIFDEKKTGQHYGSRYEESDPFTRISEIIRRPYLTKIFTEKDFSEFLEKLHVNTGHRPYPEDFYHRDQSPLADVFVNPEIRKSILEESTGDSINISAPDLRSFLKLASYNILRKSFPFDLPYNPNESEYYIRLLKILGTREKIKQLGNLVTQEDFSKEFNFELLVILEADTKAYNHAKELVSDDYFKNIRDAQNRLRQFTTNTYRKIPGAAVAKIFAVSQKATELDRLALKLGINSEIARAANREDWHVSLLQAANFQEASETLTRMMTDLAIPIIYSNLQGEELSTKQNELIGLAGKDKEFDDVLEIACRSVGIYGQKYPSRGQDFDVLMDAVRHTLELNLERNPKAYLEKRAKLSQHQFDRIFQGMPSDVEERVMKAWLDLSPRRRLRASGDVITAEEATLSRLNRIRDVVRNDLSVHLQQLFSTKVRELETVHAQGETNGPGSEQLAIYKQYLMTPEGMIRQNISMIYRSVETFIKDAQAKLKNPETPKEEKEKLGKSLGTYQGISASLKALYRLGAISEERYKARRDYLNEIEKHIGEFSGALKRLRILDPDRRSADVNTRALEEEVLLDFGKLKGTMTEENVTGQTVFDTESTVNFTNLARAPEITQSCQRLTEVTGYNHAAYSRLLDGSNEMIDIYEMRNGERIRLARSFIELSRARLTGEKQPRLVVLIDREYVNPQYQNFGYQFSSEMVLHMLERISSAPELSLIFDGNRFTASPEVKEILQTKGYRLREISGEYFINESNVRLAKYYDSLGGVNNVAQPSYTPFSNFYLIEKL